MARSPIEKLRDEARRDYPDPASLDEAVKAKEDIARRLTEIIDQIRDMGRPRQDWSRATSVKRDELIRQQAIATGQSIKVKEWIGEERRRRDAQRESMPHEELLKELGVDPANPDDLLFAALGVIRGSGCMTLSKNDAFLVSCISRYLRGRGRISSEH